MRYQYIVIQFVCSWSTSRKEILIMFEKKFMQYFFSVLYIKKESLYEIYLSKDQITGMSPDLQF